MNSFYPDAVSALYNPHARQWHFPAKYPAGFTLYPASRLELVVAPSLLTHDPASAQHGRTRKMWSRCLVQDVPEMGSAMPWVDNYFEESQLIASSSSLADPKVGRLLAFGKAVGTISRERLYDVVAYARGPTRTDLGIAQLDDQIREFSNSEGVKLLVPRITGATAPPAHQFHSPIQQICFAGNPWYNEWAKARLAVRTSGYTTLFRTNKTPYIENIQTTRFVPQMVASVGTLDTGGNEHADVAFNPWYDRQFTIIDQHGNWKVWDIEGVQNSILRKAKGLPLQASALGCVTRDDIAGDGGWGRVVWGGDLTSVMACSRRRAALFDIRLASSIGSAIDLPVDRERSLVLDMQRGHSEGYGQDAFILTSSHLSWIDIRQPGRPLLAWPQRRHRGDVSLSLELCKSNDVTTALIYSRMNSLITSYQFSTIGDEEHYPAILGDPSMLSPPFRAEDAADTGLCVGILPCKFRTKADCTGPASKYERGDEKFFSVLSVDKKLGISQRLYSTEEEPIRFAAYHKEKYAAKQVKSVEFIVDDDSEVSKTEDEDSELSEDGIEEEMQRLDKREDERERAVDDHFGYFKGLYEFPSLPTRNKSRRRMNMEEMYEMVFNGPEETLRTATEEDVHDTVQGFCDRISKVLNRRVTFGDLGIFSLFDAAQPSLLFDELQELEDGMKALLDKPEMREAYEMRTLFPLQVAGFPIGNEMAPSIKPLYDTLVHTYVSSLPENIPSRVRLRRERLCRLIATETYLASIGINIKPSPESMHPPVIEDIIQLPETPDQLQLQREKDESGPLQRLRAYTHVQTHISLPQGMCKVLDTWKTGDNPWEVEFFIESDEGVPRYRQDRRKLRREKEKRNSEIGIGIVGSQPPALLESAAQDTAGSQSQSQVERKRHGGRKAKKRKTGF